MKKIIVFIITLALTICALTGCESCSPNQSEEKTVTTNGTIASDTAADTATEALDENSKNDNMNNEDYESNEIDTSDGYGFTKALDGTLCADGIVYDEGRDISDPFDLYNDENVEKITYTDFENLLDILEKTEYADPKTGDLRLYQDATDVHIGWLGDVLVGDFTFEGDDFVWHFRAETVNEMVNHSGIKLPSREKMFINEFPDGSSIEKADYCDYNWAADAEDGRVFDLMIVFFPKTHHQYTFYSQNVRVDAKTGPNFQIHPTRVVQTFYDPFNKPLGREAFTDEVSK